ncbi:lysozyme inhibitor LprI family protein [Yersinia mollaretii]|nr:hypothetical protein [Yersinia mollaretii]PJE86269.1 hypothetical protein CU280_18930 [Yersinia mollaretii]CQD33894.1 Uncharacterized protein conserved in bacteria%2C putative lipoprotein [Yersinia mollaretii]CQH07326.1 Uncharacterized protein conserved in bacteria%2C putative lipoprotein [Yersinia mollaretii]
MHKLNYLAGCVFILFTKNALSAGYDCTSINLNETEKTICERNYLSSLDNTMNSFFSQAIDNSYSKGELSRSQRQWIVERNKCGMDSECIKDKYIERNKYLSKFEKFKDVADVFDRAGEVLDEPMKGLLKNENGFIIREEPWRVKKLISSYELSSIIGELSVNYVKILTHRVVNNDLVVFFVVSGYANNKNFSYVISIKELGSPTLEAVYEGRNIEVSIINVNNKSEGDVFYSVLENIDSGQYDNQYNTLRAFKIQVTNQSVGDLTEVSSKDLPTDEDKWIGYCGGKECESRVTSPDGKWRLASSDGSKSDLDEGMYYFPYDRPDSGVNVFLSQADTAKSKNFGYTREYVWGNGPSFYFDNDGGYACIWETNITDKITKRILPIEGLVQPYYIKYRDEDLILATYAYYNEYVKKYYREIYISKK